MTVPGARRGLDGVPFPRPRGGPGVRTVPTRRVTGASRGFGRAIAAALVREQTWESFGRPWAVDTRHVFSWTKTALTTPLPPGSLVVALSSECGPGGPGGPLSGGYAGAKAAIRFVARYAAEESTRAGLGLRVTTLLPRFTPATDLGGAAAAAYAARAGAAQDTFAARLAPALTPEQVAKAVVGLASDPTPPASKYQLDATPARLTIVTTATEFSARAAQDVVQETYLRADVDLAMPPTPTWFTGRDAVVGFLGRRVLRRADVWPLDPTRANGQPALTVHRHEGEDRTYGVQVLTVFVGRIGRITSFNDPTLVPLFAPVGPRGSRGR